MRGAAQKSGKGSRSMPGRSETKGGKSLGYTGKSGGSGGPKKKNSSVMREAVWNSMPKGQRMKEHGTTSYAKYKAGKSKMRANAASASSQRSK